MQGQYTHYIIMPNTNSAKANRISTRYDWQTFTYKDVEKTATRKVNKYDYYPSEDNTKAEIKAYMDDAGIDYSSGDTKAELVEKVHSEPHSTPQKDEEYTYTDSVVDVTTDHAAKISDMLERHPLYFASRESADGSEMCVKSDCTLAELNALPSGFAVYTNEEVKAYIAGSSKWQTDES